MTAAKAGFQRFLMRSALFDSVSQLVIFNAEVVLSHLFVGVIETPVVSRDSPNPNHTAGSV